MFLETVRAFRKIQPKTPLVVLMEELDAILDEYGEIDTVDILDGAEVLENVVFLATTNYPERLTNRYVDRPTRFASVVKMALPSKKTRRLFFEQVFKNDKDKFDLEQWVKDTDGMSIDHLNSLFNRVMLLGNTYEQAIAYLVNMTEQKLSSDEDAIDNFGFKPHAKS
jgi:SpoVK/Ycf46/Vps4 family AAA+-type ATPase